MARKYTKRTEKKVIAQDPVVEEVIVQNEQTERETPRYGESYTSLILGIIVVIISTALLLAFVQNRNADPNIIKPDSQKNANENNVNFVNGNQPNYRISTVPTLTPIVEKKDSVETDNAGISPSPVEVTPTAQKNDAQQPHKVAVNTVTNVPSKAPKPTVDPLNAGMKNSSEYTVKGGDTLWNIAERHYKDGYKWVEIAKANKLGNPGVINPGIKLILPKVDDKQIAVSQKETVMTNDEQNNKTNALVQKKIATGTTYKVVAGDNLWNIAERAYGDGNKWYKIAQANKLANPRIIHPGNNFTIPRN